MNNSYFFELEEEKMKILKMVEEKKISAEDADRLINILEESILKEEAQEKVDEREEQPANKVKIPNVKGKIVVHVYENGVKKVNITLPIAFAKFADKIPVQNFPNNQFPLDDIFKTAKENGLNIDQGMYVFVEDEEVHIYDADGVEFVSVKK